MQQDFIPPDHTMISPRQKRLMSILSGVLLGLLELTIYSRSTSFFSLKVIIGIIVLIYFIAPIPLSFYISRQAGNATEGWKAGSTTGCIGALLTAFAIGVTFIMAANGTRRGIILAILLLYTLLHAFGALLSLLGATIGSNLGKNWETYRFRRSK